MGAPPDAIWCCERSARSQPTRYSIPYKAWCWKTTIHISILSVLPMSGAPDIERRREPLMLLTSLTIRIELVSYGESGCQNSAAIRCETGSLEGGGRASAEPSFWAKVACSRHNPSTLVGLAPAVLRPL